MHNEEPSDHDTSFSSNRFFKNPFGFSKEGDESEFRLDLQWWRKALVGCPAGVQHEKYQVVQGDEEKAAFM